MLRNFPRPFSQGKLTLCVRRVVHPPGSAAARARAEHIKLLHSKARRQRTNADLDETLAHEMSHPEFPDDFKEALAGTYRHLLAIFGLVESTNMICYWYHAAHCSP